MQNCPIFSPSEPDQLIQVIGESEHRLIHLDSHTETTRGGTCQNFDRDARPIFLGLKFGQILFFWVGKFFSYFSGFCKISAIFLGLTNFQLFFGFSNFCFTHLNPLHEEHSTEKQNHSSFSYLFELRQTLHLESFYFSGFEFWGILFFGV